MNPLFKAVDAVISWWCHAVLYITLSVVFAILSVNVCLRYAAGTSLSWASELPELMFPWMIMSGVVIAAQHGSHIAVVMLTQKLGASASVGSDWRFIDGGGFISWLSVFSATGVRDRCR